MIIASVCNRNRRLALHERFPCVNPPSNWKIVRLARALGRQSDFINTVLLGQANALGTHVHYSRCDYACSPFGNFTFRIVILVFLFVFVCGRLIAGFGDQSQSRHQVDSGRDQSRNPVSRRFKFVSLFRRAARNAFTEI